MLHINDEVIVYSTGCPKCEVLEKKLSEKGIVYEKIDSIEEMMSLGIMEVPVLKAGGELMSFSKAVSWVNKQ